MYLLRAQGNNVQEGAQPFPRAPTCDAMYARVGGGYSASVLSAKEEMQISADEELQMTWPPNDGALV